MIRDQLKGVVQTAQKGPDCDSSCADFSSADLALLTFISGLIGEYIYSYG